MKLYEIISETFNVKTSELTNDTMFLELDGWDSMAHMMFITNLEDAFEIDFEGDDIVNVSTIGELKDLLKKYEVVEL